MGSRLVANSRLNKQILKTVNHKKLANKHSENVTNKIAKTVEQQMNSGDLTNGLVRYSDQGDMSNRQMIHY